MGAIQPRAAPAAPRAAEVHRVAGLGVHLELFMGATAPAAPAAPAAPGPFEYWMAHTVIVLLSND
jgi:hypothetical protein